MTIRTRARRLAGSVTIVVSTCAAVALIGATAAQAAPFFIDPDQATSGRLTLETSPWVAQDSHGVRQLALGEQLILSPGDVGYWEIRASHDDPSGPASLSVELTSSGTLAQHPEGLRLVFQQCLTEWTGLAEGAPHCAGPGGAITLGPAMVTVGTYLVDLAAGSNQHLLVTARIDGTDSSLQDLEGTAGIGLTATRTDGVSSPPTDPPLATTGIDGASLLRMLGVGVAAIGIGAGMRMLNRPIRGKKSVA